MEIKKLNLKKIIDDSGSLVFFESNRDIPFDIKRVYYIYNFSDNSHRGFHAHKKLMQVLICIGGSCKIRLDDGTNKSEVLLNSPSEGLIIENTIWREMYDFSANAILLVLASEYYDESDYIRSYDEFLKYIKEC